MSRQLANSGASKESGVERSMRLTASQVNMIAGGVAGCIAKTIVAPLSRLTVLSQVSSLFPKEQGGANAFSISHKENVTQTLRRIAKHQGVWSLWNGNLTSVIHRFPYSAINFAVFEVANNQLTQITGKTDTTSNRFISGAISGAAACTACYPLDLIRTRLTVANSFGPTNNNTNNKAGGKIIALIKDIILKEGVAGLYRGLPVSIFVTAPNLAISFSIYGYVKNKLMSIGGVFTYYKLNDKNPHLSVLGSLCSGCLSGIASSSVIFPMDVIRKRMQVIGQLVPHSTEQKIGSEIIHSTNANTLIQAIRYNEISNIHIENGEITSTANTTHRSINIPNTNCELTNTCLPNTTTTTTNTNTTSNTSTTHTNTTHTRTPTPLHKLTTFQQALHIYKSDGVRGFYRGLAPELLKVCPMVAIMYCSYELVQEQLNERFV